MHYIDCHIVSILFMQIREMALNMLIASYEMD
jgi:hypothetical protein